MAVRLLVKLIEESESTFEATVDEDNHWSIERSGIYEEVSPSTLTAMENFLSNEAAIGVSSLGYLPDVRNAYAYGLVEALPGTEILGDLYEVVYDGDISPFATF